MNWSSDFLLVELSQNPPIPDYYNLYYSGWSNADIAPNSSVGIHHPAGDIKKISFEYDPATSYTDGSPDDNYWQVIYEAENGTVEGVSSGSPLFNPDHRIVGQLHDGQGGVFCSVTHEARYGKFSLSWDYGSSASTRLKDWLDPNNTGATTLDGISDYSAPEPPLLKLKTYRHRHGFTFVTHPRLVWNAVQGHCLTYELYRAISPGNWQVVEITTGTSWIDHEIIIDGRPDPIEYKVKAINNIPLESQYSNVVTANTTFQQKIQSNTDALPYYYKLSPNFPNPFNPITTIIYQLAEESIVVLKIYDLTGREIKTIVDGTENAGYKNIMWDGKDKNGRLVPSGVYLYRLDAISKESDKELHETKKMVLLQYIRLNSTINQGARLSLILPKFFPECLVI